MKTVLVTGAANGLGRELVKRAAADGHRVIGLDRVALHDRPSGTSFIACDLRYLASIEQAVAELEADRHPVDLLINNAAIGNLAPLEHVEPDWVADCLAVNLT